MAGLRRRRCGTGFAYLDGRGRRVGATTVARIRALAIPPAWTDVWICADPRGHLQACGRDARGRKQYRYHPAWRARRDRDKFGRLEPFGTRLPALRRRLRRDLALPGLPREKVLAVVVSLLGHTLVRIGNDEYARQNDSFGLTTLRDRHLAFVRQGRARLRFRGKSGKRHEVAVDDRRLVRLLRRCRQLPGQSLFQYLDDDGRHQPVDSGMVNGYLHDAVGDGFTAKDFRTWGGTVLAVAALLREAGDAPAEAAAVGAVKQVAAALGNSAAVCRASYIHPAVFEDWRRGDRIRRAPPALAGQPRKLEKFVLRLLRQHRRIPGA
jgi:DNA topoisomerase IB